MDLHGAKPPFMTNLGAGRNVDTFLCTDVPRILPPLALSRYTLRSIAINTNGFCVNVVVCRAAAGATRNGKEVISVRAKGDNFPRKGGVK
jgi:hypothetical protein